MNITLHRLSYLTTHTSGWLLVDQKRFATIERPWRPEPTGPGGERRQSCVPEGEYRVIPHNSDRFPGTYALINHSLGVYYQPEDLPAGQTWGRSAILIHIGNYVKDIIGCIAVGVDHSGGAVAPSVTKSAIAMGRLRNILGSKGEHTLVVTSRL